VGFVWLIPYRYRVVAPHRAQLLMRVHVRVELLTCLAAAGAYSSTMKIKLTMDICIGVSLRLYMRIIPAGVSINRSDKESCPASMRLMYELLRDSSGLLDLV
jgi:hypothetical protein